MKILPKLINLAAGSRVQVAVVEMEVEVAAAAAAIRITVRLIGARSSTSLARECSKA